MGSVMGKMDPNATNDVDSNGNIVATGTPGATTSADPNMGLSAGQMFTRKALSGAIQGAGNAAAKQNTMAPGMRTAQAPQQNSTQIAQPNFLQQAQSQGASSTQPVVPPQNTGTAPIANVGINGNKSPFAKGPNPSLFYGAPGGF